MCGITFFARKNGAYDFSVLEKTALSMSNRGPDGTTFSALTTKSGMNYGFGHNLLQISGKDEEGIQPFYDSTRRYVLLYNGEIYNTAELKALEIFKEYKFRTGTDTEVLVELLVQLRLEGLKLVEGMYAFVLLDTESDTVIMARDHAGMKPLFYSYLDGELVITSELRAQTKAREKVFELNKNQIHNYLLYRHSKGPETLLKGVMEVLPSEYVIWQGGGIEKGETKKYLHDKGDGHLFTPKIKELLVKAVKNHVPENQKYGLLLSGGVDSTLILALLNELGIKEVDCYTAVPKGMVDEDVKFSELAVEQYGGKLNKIEYDASILSNLEKYAGELSTPVADGAGLLTWWITRNEVNESTVLLSGAGADELFCGYHRHDAFYTLLQFERFFSNKIIKIGLQFLGALAGKKSNLGFFARAISSNYEQTFINLTASGGWKVNELNESSSHFEKSDSNNEVDIKIKLQFGINYDRTNYLVGDVLSVTDSASMMNGKEVRMPYLNTDLFGVVMSSDATELISHSSKWVLKDFLKKLKGAEFTKRKKKGFGTDFTAFFKLPENMAMAKSLLTEMHWLHQYVNQDAIKTHITRLEAGKAGSAQGVLSLLILDYWVKVNGVKTTI